MTLAVRAWLWRRGARAMAPEVGLHPLRGLCTPWDGQWRVDLAAGIVATGVESLHVVEVKGSLADLRREDLGAGKWVLDYQTLGLTPWLAHVDTITPGHLTSLPRAWGLLSVDADGHVRVTRDPARIVETDARSPGIEATRAYRAMASVLTAQALPRLFAANVAQALALMAEAGVDRPWRQWLPASHGQWPVDDDSEEPGMKIL